MSSNPTCDVVNDDTLKCFFYTISTETSDENFWGKLCDKLNISIQNLSRGYLWHRDEFRVCIPLHDNFSNDVPPYLESATCFGDNIEDEWFIVYLLFELTKQFPNIIIQVIDNDGDFLLIEAADCLPFWANPNNTENRVFIYNNHIHLVTKNVNTQLSIKEAINIVANEPDRTRASPQIQETILNRIAGYPEKIKDNLHQAVVKLPMDIATLLTMKPSLISPIVTTYCSHDVIDAKSCKDVEYTDCINVGIKFTKCLYAMLVHSKSINSMRNRNISENDKKSVLGYKLTCGYQMIMNKSSNNLFSSKEYNKYLNSLKENGYFRDNIEGSQAYNQLLEKAQTYFNQIECPISTHVSDSVTKLMSTEDFLEVKEIIKDKKETDFEENNDDWLNIHPEQLNELLDKRYGKKNTFENNDVINPQTITSKLTDFLKQTSDFEGIEQINEDTDTINLDCDEFVKSVEKFLNFLSSDSNDIENSDSECDDELEDMTTDIDNELAHKLVIGSEDKENVVIGNMVKSMKEEEGSSGPSSNLLKTIGINKLDLLDSDDD